MKRRVSPQSPEVSGWEQTSDRDGTFMVVVSARKETWGRNEALRDEPEDRGLRNGSQNPQVQPADLGAAAEPGVAGPAQRQGREKGAGLSHGSRSGLGHNVSNRSSQSSSSKEPRGKPSGVDSQWSRTGTLRTRESPDESGHVGLSQAAPDSTLPGVSTSHERRREVWSAGGAVLKPATFQEFRKTHFT